MEPFTIPARNGWVTPAEVIAIAHEKCDAATDAHRHCVFTIESDMTPDSDDFVWDEDCDIQIAYVTA